MIKYIQYLMVVVAYMDLDGKNYGDDDAMRYEI